MFDVSIEGSRISIRRSDEKIQSDSSNTNHLHPSCDFTVSVVDSHDDERIARILKKNLEKTPH